VLCGRRSRAFQYISIHADDIYPMNSSGTCSGVGGDSPDPIRSSSSSSSTIIVIIIVVSGPLK
jgi:hypothetical protein